MKNPELFSPAEKIGELLNQELKKNPHFYFFSPDETTSNRFDKVFEVESRAWGNLRTEPWDLPQSPDGRIVELLSESVLFSVMTGHLMNNEPAMMGSYEAFFSIITSQLLQQIKFFKQSNKVSWRNRYPAVNLLSTSTCWRQDHNGFTHQSPALISTLLSVPSRLVNCFFPVDDTSAITVFNYMLNSKNVVNLATFNKNPLPRLTTQDFNEQNFSTGAAILPEFSNPNPDLIFVGVGDIVSNETIAALKLLKSDLPELKLRFVNIFTLSHNTIGSTDRPMSPEIFNNLFTNDKPIIANFHGYPETLHSILKTYTPTRTIITHGFLEEGSTTTPFEMLRKNHASRFDLAIEAAKILGYPNLAFKYHTKMDTAHLFAKKNGFDQE